MSNDFQSDWRWGTAKGAREFDRAVDRSLTFRERLEWLEDMEKLSARMQSSLKSGGGDPKQKRRRL